MADKRYTAPIADDDEEENTAKYRLPFALCKDYGIEIQPWWTPKDAWAALEGKGVNPNREYEAFFEKKVSAKKSREKKKYKNQQAKDPNENPDYNYEHVDGQIAGVEKGNPMTFKEANTGKCNPMIWAGLSDRGFMGVQKHFGYSTNCQTCVAVFEARLRGYDVEALPNFKNGYIKDLSHDTSLIWRDANGNHPTKVEKPKRERASAFLDKNIEDNARYTVEYRYGNSHVGHIVCISRQDGHLKIYDPQISDQVGHIDEYFMGKTHIKLTRVDNMEFDGEFADHVMKSTKKETKYLKEHKNNG